MTPDELALEQWADDGGPIPGGGGASFELGSRPVEHQIGASSLKPYRIGASFEVLGRDEADARHILRSSLLPLSDDAYIKHCSTDSRAEAL